MPERSASKGRINGMVIVMSTLNITESAHGDIAKVNNAGRTPIGSGRIKKILEPTNAVSNKLVHRDGEITQEHSQRGLIRE